MLVLALLLLLALPLNAQQIQGYFNPSGLFDTRLGADECGFYNGTTSQKTAATAFCTGYPCTIFAYVRPRLASASQTVAMATTGSDGLSGFAIGQETTYLRAAALGDLGQSASYRTDLFQANIPVRVGVIFVDASTRYACSSAPSVGCTESGEGDAGTLGTIDQTNIGFWETNLGISRRYLGNIYEVAVWNAALDEVDDWALYASGVAADDAGFSAGGVDHWWRGDDPEDYGDGGTLGSDIDLTVQDVGSCGTIQEGGGEEEGGEGTLEILILSELNGATDDRRRTAPALFKRANLGTASLANPASFTVPAGSSHTVRIENLPAFSYPYGVCTGAGCIPASFSNGSTCTLGATANQQGECATESNIAVSGGGIKRVVFVADGISDYQGEGAAGGSNVGGQNGDPFYVTNTDCTGAGSFQAQLDAARDAGGGWIAPDPDTFGIDANLAWSCPTLNTEGEFWLTGELITVDFSSVRNTQFNTTGFTINSLKRDGSGCVDTNDIIVRNTNSLFPSSKALPVFRIARGSSGNSCSGLGEDMGRIVLAHNTWIKQHPTGVGDDIFGMTRNTMRDITLQGNLISRGNVYGVIVQNGVVGWQAFFNAGAHRGDRNPWLTWNVSDSPNTSEPSEFQGEWKWNVMGVDTNTGQVSLITRKGWFQVTDNWYVAHSGLAGSRRVLSNFCIDPDNGLSQESAACQSAPAKPGVATGNLQTRNMIFSRYNVDFPMELQELWNISNTEDTSLATITPYSANHYMNALEVLKRAGRRPLSAAASADIDELEDEVEASQPVTIVDDDAEDDFSQWAAQGHFTLSTDTAVSGTQSFKSATTGGDATLFNSRTDANNFFESWIRWTGTAPVSDFTFATFKDGGGSTVYTLEFNASDARLQLQDASGERQLGSGTSINTWYHIRSLFRQRFTTGSCSCSGTNSAAAVDPDCNRVSAGVAYGNTSRGSQSLNTDLWFGGSSPVIAEVVLHQAPSGFTYYLDDVGASPTNFCSQMGCSEGGGEMAAAPEGVVVAQLTEDSDAGTPGGDDGAAIAYYDTLAYSTSRGQIFFGRGEQLTASAFFWTPWVMDLDGSNAAQLNTNRIRDPWGWTPNDLIYFRSGTTGLGIMDPDDGSWETKIAGVSSGNICQVGANLVAVYEAPATANEICAYTSTDGADSFSETECHTLDDAWPAASFHRVRASCVDNDTDGIPDYWHYKKTGSNTAIVLDTRDGSSYGYTWDDPGDGVLTVQDLSHPDVMPDEATMYGAWLSFGLGSDGVGFIYPFDLDTGLAGTAMDLPRWSNWNYRAAGVHSETNQIALSKSTGGSEVGLYDRSGDALLFSLAWPNEPGVPYWSEIAAQMAASNVIIMRGPDENGVPQIFKVTYSPP